MKVENDMDALSEVDPTGMNTDEVYVPPEFSIIKAESEVSLVLRSFSLLCWLFVRVCMCAYVHLCVLHMSCYVIQHNCLEACFVGCDVISYTRNLKMFLRGIIAPINIGVLVSPLPDQEGNKLQRQKILIFIYPIYNHNWRNISTIYIYIYITRLASNKIFSPLNKIHQEVGQAKDLLAPW